MFYLVLFSIFILTVAFGFLVAFLINYHFKKLGIDDDKNAQKITKVYKKGLFILFLLSAFSLISLIFIR